MKKYEAFYLVASVLTDDEVQKIIDQFTEVVEKNGGSVESAALWERRKLAYEVAGHKDGAYILMNFEAPAPCPAELSRLMRISDSVIRHRIFALGA